MMPYVMTLFKWKYEILIYSGIIDSYFGISDVCDNLISSKTCTCVHLAPMEMNVKCYVMS